MAQQKCQNCSRQYFHLSRHLHAAMQFPQLVCFRTTASVLHSFGCTSLSPPFPLPTPSDPQSISASLPSFAPSARNILSSNCATPWIHPAACSSPPPASRACLRNTTIVSHCFSVIPATMYPAKHKSNSLSNRIPHPAIRTPSRPQIYSPRSLFIPSSAFRANSNASPPSRFTGDCTRPGTLPNPIPMRNRSGHIRARRSIINSGMPGVLADRLKFIPRRNRIRQPDQFPFQLRPRCLLQPLPQQRAQISAASSSSPRPRSTLHIVSLFVFTCTLSYNYIYLYDLYN